MDVLVTASLWHPTPDRILVIKKVITDHLCAGVTRLNIVPCKRQAADNDVKGGPLRSRSPRHLESVHGTKTLLMISRVDQTFWATFASRRPALLNGRIRAGVLVLTIFTLDISHFILTRCLHFQPLLPQFHCKSHPDYPTCQQLAWDSYLEDNNASSANRLQIVVDSTDSSAAGKP
jgi:hypothetical protein